MFHPGRTQKITERIAMVRTGISNFYLYHTEAGTIAFDCGANILLARAALRNLGIDPGTVRAVFLTHSDFDHRSGLRLFPNAAIYLSESEVPLIIGQKPRRFIVYNAGIKNHTPLADGESITVGDTTVQMVAAPGHTTGSACYRIGGDAIATGDLLLITRDHRVKQFSFVQNMDHAGNLATLKSLYAEGFFSGSRYLLTGHSGFGKTDALSFAEL